MRAADVLAQRLYKAGCRFAFGMPGGEVLVMLDALERAGIRFILAKHENAAAFMAEGVWHATGAPGILLGTVGPGILNAVNAVANAQQDRVALIAIAGCVDPAEALSYSHQVLDHTAVFGPVCKAVFTMTAAGAGQLADKAVMIAQSPRPGPVFIDIPVSVADVEVPRPYAFQHAPPASVIPAAGAALDHARAALAKAERPLVIAGFDAVRDGAGEALARFCQARGAPLVTTYKAKGLIPEDDPIAIGAAGLSPSADAVLHSLVRSADTIVLAGYDPIEMRIGWRDLWDPAQTDVIEIVARPNDQYMHQATVSFVADVQQTLNLLGEAPAGPPAWSDGSPARARAALRAGNGATAAWGPGAIAAAAREALPREAVVTADSGAHRIVLSQVFDCYAPRGMLQSAALCTMGCALPLGIGVKLAEPERPVCVFIGDGGLMMTLGELSTLSDYGIALPIVVFDDRSLALIELKQRGMQLSNAGVDFEGGYDYAKLAEAFGGRAIRADSRERLKAALADALAAPRFTLIVCPLERGAYDGIL